jgi:hypothetical protein
MSLQLLHEAVFAGLAGDIDRLEDLVKTGNVDLTSLALWAAAFCSDRTSTEVLTTLIKFRKPSEKILSHAVAQGDWEATKLIGSALCEHENHATWSRITNIIAECKVKNSRVMAAEWLAENL